MTPPPLPSWAQRDPQAAQLHSDYPCYDCGHVGSSLTCDACHRPICDGCYWLRHSHEGREAFPCRIDALVGADGRTPPDDYRGPPR